MKWKVEKTSESGNKTKEVVFQIEQKSFLAIKQIGSILKKKIWGNKKVFGSKDFPWDEIIAEAKRRLGITKSDLRPFSGEIIFCDEATFIQAQKLNKKISEAIAAKNKGKKPTANDICQKISKKNLKIVLSNKNDRNYKQRLELLLLNAFGLTVYTEGWLGLSRWQKPENSRKIIKQKTPDLHTAIRMQDHILANYGDDRQGEVAKLQSIEAVIRKCNTLLLNWKSAKPQRKRVISKKLAISILSLKNCKNELKSIVRDQLSLILPWRDKTGRPNPGALAARTIVSLNELSARFKEIRAIEPYIALRRELLAYLEEWQKATIAEAMKFAKQRRTIRAIEVLKSVIISPFWEQAEQAKFWLLNYQLEKNCKYPNPDIYNKHLATAIEILQDNLESTNKGGANA